MLIGAAGAAFYMVTRSQGAQLPGLPGVPTFHSIPIPGLAPAAPAAGAVARPATGPRGIRNHNPGNITAGILPWNGQAGTDGRYIIFESPLYGLRAIYRLLSNYRSLYGINTIQKIANRWAPGPENDPVAYAANVSRFATIPADQPLDFNSFDTMNRVARGIIGAENGASWVNHYPAALHSQAWAIRG